MSASAGWVGAWISPLLVVALATWLLRAAARRLAPDDRTLPNLVTLLFLVHVAFSTALFAISYLRLPVLQDLQLGGGFWLFSGDSDGYHLRALQKLELLRRGHGISVTGPSAVYELFLALIYLVFAPLPLVGALFNCLFVAAAGLLAYGLAWQLDSDRTGRYAALLLVVCWPSGFIWASQLLRDMGALFLTFAALTTIVAAIEAPSARAFVVRTGTMMTAVFMLAAMRNYSGWLLLMAVGAAIAAVCISPRRSRIVYAFCTIVFAGVAVLLGSGAQTGAAVDRQLSAALALPASSDSNSAETTTPLRDPARTSRARSAGAAATEAGRAPGQTGTTSPRVHAKHRGAPATSWRRPLDAAALVPRIVEEKRRDLLKGSNAVLDAGADVMTWPRLLIFLPKAAANAMFAPYPWDSTIGRSTGIFKVLALAETGLVIILLPVLAYGVIQVARHPTWQSLFVLAFALLMIGFLGLFIPNLGGLVRLRSQAMLPLLTLALAHNGLSVFGRVVRFSARLRPLSRP